MFQQGKGLWHLTAVLSVKNCLIKISSFHHKSTEFHWVYTYTHTQRTQHFMVTKLIILLEKIMAWLSAGPVKLNLKTSRFLVTQTANPVVKVALFPLLSSHPYLLSHHGLLIYVSHLMYLTSVLLFSILLSLYQTRCSSTHAWKTNEITNGEKIKVSV